MRRKPVSKLFLKFPTDGKPTAMMTMMFNERYAAKLASDRSVFANLVEIRLTLGDLFLLSNGQLTVSYSGRWWKMPTPFKK